MPSSAIDSSSTSLFPVRGTTQVPGGDEAMTTIMLNMRISFTTPSNPHMMGHWMD
jgi:hypothetical protein